MAAATEPREAVPAGATNEHTATESASMEASWKDAEELEKRAVASCSCGDRGGNVDQSTLEAD